MNKLPKKKKPTIIKLDDDFSITWDSRQWILLDYQITNEEGKRPQNPRTSYHGTLPQVLHTVIERQLGSVSGGIQELLDKYDTLISKMVKCAESLSKQLNSIEDE